ncbi:MAG TPA: YceI family protein [Terriglobales bacterium]|jgi:polyisoprenoid-binding protein YceI|nr:YceI family protein [Terriglobales bacterium]
MRKARVFLLSATFLWVLAGRCLATSSPVDVEHSTLTVQVFKKGLFSGFAHDHQIAAPLSSGIVDPAAPSVEVHFDTRKLKVLDPDASVSDRAKIQETMLSDKVLDAGHFTEIVFVSRNVKVAGENTYAVEGDLTLHGVTHPLVLAVSLRNGHYTGSVNVKQTDFGITPISLVGGSVKVKDVVEITFDIVLAK